MFSSESIIKMGNGTLKNINNVRRGEFIMNKMNKPVRIDNITQSNMNVVVVQLNNGTGIFYVSPNAKFLSHKVNNDGSHLLEKCSISEINTNGCMLKSSLKLFSANSNVSLTTYDNSDPNLTKMCYNITTLDNTNSFFVNGVIVLYD